MTKTFPCEQNRKADQKIQAIIRLKAVSKPAGSASQAYAFPRHFFRDAHIRTARKLAMSRIITAFKAGIIVRVFVNDVTRAHPTLQLVNRISGCGRFRNAKVDVGHIHASVPERITTCSIRMKLAAKVCVVSVLKHAFAWARG